MEREVRLGERCGDCPRAVSADVVEAQMERGEAGGDAAIARALSASMLLALVIERGEAGERGGDRPRAISTDAVGAQNRGEVRPVSDAAIALARRQRRCALLFHRWSEVRPVSDAARSPARRQSCRCG